MKKHSSKARIKREDFITQWNVHLKETEYNPLEDPHANYYFITKAAKQRLKDLKLEMKRANHHKSPKTKEYIQQLSSKIRFEFPRLKLPLINPLPEDSSLRKSDRKLSEQFHLKIMTERGQDHEHYNSSLSKLANKKEQLQQQQQQQRMNKVEMTREQMGKGKSKKKLRSMRVSKQQIKVNHDEFLMFLSKKKGELLLQDKPKN